jgi:hypothetical protein
MWSLLWTIFAITMLFLFARYFGGMGIGAPYLPVRKQDIEAAFKLVDLGSQDVVIDLGSGDGRLLVESANRGARVIGYELNPILCAISMFRLRRFRSQAEVHRRNLLSADVSQATVIFIFGFAWIMPLVADQLKKEARREVKIISFAYELPGFVEIKKEGIARLYRIPAKD